MALQLSHLACGHRDRETRQETGENTRKTCCTYGHHCAAASSSSYRQQKHKRLPIAVRMSVSWLIECACWPVVRRRKDCRPGTVSCVSVCLDGVALLILCSDANCKGARPVRGVQIFLFTRVPRLFLWGRRRFCAPHGGGETQISSRFLGNYRNRGDSCWL